MYYYKNNTFIIYKNNFMQIYIDGENVWNIKQSRFFTKKTFGGICKLHSQHLINANYKVYKN